MNEGKPLLFVSHPKTGSVGYWSKDDYTKNKVPKSIAKIFALAEIKPLHDEKSYLDVTLNFIERKLVDLAQRI